ncbi:MAG: hypothetical protein WC648_04965 [Candidatus Paceibacterota bacterium]|jgi:hypothetical protein
MNNYDIYFQVYNTSSKQWVKYDRTQGRIVDIKNDGKPYENVPVYGDVKND